jgi:acyl-CoA synthetase (AMP-forming)/AMP-acid ligase II
LPPEQIDIRPTSVGKAMPDTEVHIVDDEGQRVGPGVVGELIVRGDHVMAGYWEMPEQTVEVLRDGPAGEKLLYTGDLFSMDAEGYLYFVGRKDDLIKTRGEKVSPREIENVLYEMEGIVEAAIVAVPDEMLGHALKAVITLEPGVCLTQQDVLRYCAQRLEAPMTPKWVEFRRELPKTASGKIDKRELMHSALGE